MAPFRKYDTCFFERYAALLLQAVLGHKFDGLINKDRPDLQSPDGKTLGIEVTRAMEGGRPAALKILKDMAGIHPADADERADYESMLESGYAYGLQRGQYVGVTEYSYWKLAKPLKHIIANKVGKVTSGFYGSFDEFGLFIFCQDALTMDDVRRAASYTMELQKGSESSFYARLFLSDPSALYVCNLEEGVSSDFRVIDYTLTEAQRRSIYLSSLRLK